MKSGDKLKVQLRGGEVVDALYIRQEETCYAENGDKVELHVLVACQELPEGYTSNPLDKSLVLIVGREAQLRWECSLVEEVQP